MFKKNFILLNNYNNDNYQFSSYDSLNYKDINEIIRKLIIILLLIFNANLLNNFHLFLDEYKDNNIRNNLKLILIFLNIKNTFISLKLEYS